MNDIELIGHLPTVFISSTCYDLKVNGKPPVPTKESSSVR